MLVKNQLGEIPSPSSNNLNKPMTPTTMQNSNRVSLNTVEKAQAYLDSQGRTYDFITDEDIPYIFTYCGRCGGSGRYSGYSTRGFQCFGCGGSGGKKKATIMDLAKKARRQELASIKADAKATAKQERMLEGQRNWCEKNGFGRITFEEKNAVMEARKIEQAEENKASALEKGLTHLGEIKVRTDFTDMTFTRQSKPFESFYSDTPQCAFTFEDENGSQVSWITAHYAMSDYEIGDKVSFRATPQKHDEYQGTPQTKVNRLVLAK